MQPTGSKDAFERAAKKHQASFRAASPTISDVGRSPTDAKGQRNSHLLAQGCELDNLYQDIRGEGGAVDFFRQCGIQWWKSARSGDGKETDSPTRNMASSQVACVNFLLPLASIAGALTAVLRAIDDDVKNVVDIAYVGDPSLVEFEWNGVGSSLEGGYVRGAQNTSVDAFLVAETQAGQRRAYLIEWKYVEKYLSTRPAFKGAGKAGDTRRLRYDERFHARFSSFKPEMKFALDDFFYEPFYQLMRQRLLADRMVHKRELCVDEAKVVVVVPQENWAYRVVSHEKFCTSPPLAKRFPGKTVAEVMRASLKDPDAQFAMVAPSALANAIAQALPRETAEWVTYWRCRYGV